MPQLIHLSEAAETCGDRCANAFNFSLTVTKLKSAYMPDSAMLPHTFSHDGATYVVSFKPIGDQWRAALYKRDDGSITELGPVLGHGGC
jgi:hypothetical protein